MPLGPGTRLGPYEIVSAIGAGGMGEVYRARDSRLDRTVAIKVLTGALAADSASRRRFEHEARTIAALNDPHICTLHDVGRHGEPEGRTRTQVSTSGGTQLRWSSDGKEIFYVAPDGRMMAVSIAFGGASPDVKLPAPLFQTHLATGISVLGNKPQYAVSRDGRFLLNTAIESACAPIVVAVNWMKKLAK